MNETLALHSTGLSASTSPDFLRDRSIYRSSHAPSYNILHPLITPPSLPPSLPPSGFRPDRVDLNLTVLFGYLGAALVVAYLVLARCVKEER